MYQNAFDEDIEVYNYKFSNTKKAMCCVYNNIKTIALDKEAIKSKIEEKILLSEELSHYRTGSLYLINSNFNKAIYRNNNIKFEAKAKRNSVENLLPVSCIKECIKNDIIELSEMAKALDVTEEFLAYAINMYKSKRLLTYL